MNMLDNHSNQNAHQRNHLYNGNISLSTYNVKRYGKTKYDAIHEIFHKNTFLLIQETWLSDVEFMRQFKLHFPGTECISTNKMDTGEIRAGRPYGGVGICYHTDIKCTLHSQIMCKCTFIRMNKILANRN